MAGGHIGGESTERRSRSAACALDRLPEPRNVGPELHNDLLVQASGHARQREQVVGDIGRASELIADLSGDLSEERHHLVGDNGAPAWIARFS